MTWQMYRWVWQLRSPLHVGCGPAGALNRTRLYIPARNMWAALTAEIARRLDNASFPAYTDIGRILQEHVRFTYLYPAEQVNGRWLAWLPHYVQEDKKAGLYWYREDNARSLPDRRFRQRLLHTQPGTALAPGTGAAEDGTLREVEYIQPFWRTEKTSGDTMPHPVAFVGYLFLRESWPSDIEHIKNTLQGIRELYVGGETRYGFGHLSLLLHNSQGPWERVSDCFGAQVHLTQDEPVIENPHHLFAHTFQDHDPAEKGAWELLVQWDWDTFRSLESPHWVPGSQARSATRFIILDSGLWQAQR